MKLLENHLLLLIKAEVVHILEKNVYLREEIRVHHDIVAVDRYQRKRLLHDSLERFCRIRLRHIEKNTCNAS